jgi:cysteine desulfurase
MRHIYLDYAATTPTHPEAIEAMLPYFRVLSGNPSAAHSYGQRSKAPVGPAHGNAAALLSCAGDEVIFTASGTESNNTVIKGVADAQKEKGNHIICSQIEHSAILEPCRYLARRGFQVSFVPPDGHGIIDPDELRKAITGKTVLISIMHANNEVGTIQPIPEIGRIAGEFGIPFHTDAVQSFGYVPLNVAEMGVNYLSISAHKCYGPKGIGGLYIRKGSPYTPLLHGGGQEQGRRSGTHNIPGIAGFAKAMELARAEMETNTAFLFQLRLRLIDGLIGRCTGVSINGHLDFTLPHIISVTFAGVNNEELLRALDAEGIYISRGAACGAARKEPSHVLLAMGLTAEQVHNTVRFSLGKWNTEAEIDEVINIIPPIVGKLRTGK